jgi:hypothetical protein
VPVEMPGIVRKGPYRVRQEMVSRTALRSASRKSPGGDTRNE